MAIPVTQPASEPMNEKEMPAKFLIDDVRKPLYVSVGAGEFAVEKLRDFSEELPGKLSSLQGQVHDKVVGFPDQAKELVEQVEEYMAKVGELASELYKEFAARGEKIVAHRK